MRKIVLTSSGFSTENLKKEFKKLFVKDMKEVKVLYIPVASELTLDNEDNEWVQREINAIFDMGIIKDNFIKYSLEYDINLTSFDVVYMGGGNSFYLLKRLKEKNFDKKLKQAIENGLIYVGASAGSMILGLDVEADQQFFYEENNYCKNNDGLKWIDSIIIPHFQSIPKDKLEMFIESKNDKVIGIKDGEAVFILDDNEYKV